MAYVAPNGIIQLMKGVNLDNRYMHTIYFATANAQNTYFASKVTHTFNNQMYTRHNSDVIRVSIPCDSISDCTYLRFQNKNNNKWYYAFVKAVNYINENVTEVIFEIDVMQTWFIQNGTLLPCYIERQHVTNDTFGTNLEAEPIGSDVYDFTRINVADVDNDFSSYDVVYSTTEEPLESDMLRDGIVCGSAYYSLPKTSATSGVLKNELSDALGSWDKNKQKADIVDMFMFPSTFCLAGHNSDTYYVVHDGKFDNYTPKNNKLHSYPYSSLYITTNDGNCGMYRWEYFDGDIIHSQSGAQFDLNATLTGGGFIEMHPHAYNGITENYDSKICMQNFPKCSWYYDAYQAWIASGGQYKTQYEMNMLQKKGTIALLQEGVSGVSSIVGQGISAQASQQVKKPNPVTPKARAASAVASGISTVLTEESTYLDLTEAREKLAFEFKDARYEPNILLGAQVPNISVGKEYLGFKFFKLHVRDDEAKRIDDFFSVYGYAINKVETPNLNGRQYWNFIKTRNAQVSGDMPASSKAAIARIFDGGIFFWKNGDQVGNFAISVTQGSINNPIV